MFGIKVPTEEELRAARDRRMSWTRDNLIRAEEISGRAPDSDFARFNLLSLPAWLEVARLADVPHVPARLVMEFPIEDYEQALNSPGAEGNRYENHEVAILSSLQPDEMIRMEQVAPVTIKRQLSIGQSMGNGTQIGHSGGSCLDLFEERFCDTLLDLGEDQVRAYARPVVPTRDIAGSFDGAKGFWPEEFRVFIEDGEVVGVSNYYIQVSMDLETHGKAAREAVKMAGRILSQMKALNLGIGNHRLAPGCDEGAAAIDVTLDFLTREDGEVLFLEGGPAGMVAAHPCCFGQDGRDIDEYFLHGVALSLDSPPLPLDVINALDTVEPSEDTAALPSI